MNGRIATGDEVGNETSDLIQRNIIDAKAPYEIVNILDVLLMGLWSEQCLEHPLSALDLTDVAQLFERRNTFPHYRNLPRTVIDILHTDRSCRASVNGTFIVLDGDELSLIIKNRPVFLEKFIDQVTGSTVEVG